MGTIKNNITFPLLKEVKSFYSGGDHQGNFQQLNFPQLLSGNFGITNYGSPVTDTTAPLLNNCTYFGIYSTFSSAKINSLLHQFLSVQPASGKTIDLSGVLSSPPTGQGIIDKNTLIANGNTVITN